ncbi:invasion associated locus b family protein [Methylobacterium sp. Leaf399]|uniref:hypothetical protein n=1 Tax=unclassified Methylobacterium TaxID=2615210 RepID=UPI0006FD49D2|nr:MULTISPECIES: hypothetical protein [unclassified Methylobacterium]KQP55234.1 invasion associated locus b family protein [Methylobacterium sp. Leaf108]KQT09974.1 invasion associated locus b family protein [Methylobacterium sp. Leaf399]KQT87588.1 invasion associated locus b family protein [Methylobacterium sp. Leaf466]
MSRVVARSLVLGTSALVLLSVPIAGPVGPGPALAQQQAPAAVEETEAPPSRKRGRRGREASREATRTAPGMQQATPVAIFGDWNVFASGQGKTRVCYAIAQPQTRTPKTLKRDSAYLFVTVRKGENIQNEVAVMLGFPAKPAASQAKPAAAAAPAISASGDPALALGAVRYGLVVKDGNAWLQNPAEEARVVAEMSRTPKVVVKATSMKGNPTSDEYALAGFGDAMKRTREECR